MELHHRIEIVAGDGRPLLRKWAISPIGIERLAREADRLERGRHPGVVELVDVADDHLDLGWAGEETLALARLTPAAAASLIGRVAATVADLHDLGIVHGRIDASHVVVGPGGHPRLCGLRGSDAAAREAGPADDVADLGRLLQQAIGMGAEPDVVPDRRWRARPRSAGQARALDDMAARAADEDPARRPTARALANALADLAPDGRGVDAGGPQAGSLPASPAATDLMAVDLSSVDLTAPDLTALGEAGPPPAPAPVVRADRPIDDQLRPAAAPHGRPTKVPGVRLVVPPAAGSSPRRRRIAPPERPQTAADRAPAEGPTRWRRSKARSRRGRRVPLLSVAGTALGLVVTGLALTSHQPAGLPPGAAAAPGPLVVARAAPQPEPTSTTSSPATTEPPGPAVIHGRTVEVGGRRFVVGEPGDRVSVADWDCDGDLAAGLVRPTTGEVFVFDRWPESGSTTVDARVQVAGAVQLVGSRPGNGCAPPRVLLDDGSSMGLALDAGR